MTTSELGTILRAFWRDLRDALFSRDIDAVLRRLDAENAELDKQLKARREKGR